MGFVSIRIGGYGFSRQHVSFLTASHRTFRLLLCLFCCLAPSTLMATTQCPRPAIKHELAAAREKLSLSKRTYDQVARELRALKQSGQADAGMLRDYTTYLQRVQDLVDENRRLVRKLEALCAPAGGPASGTGGGQALPGSPAPPEGDELASLDRRLQDSLAAFDEMLLKRLDAIRAESAEKMRDLAQQAAQAAAHARQRGGGAAGHASKSGGEAGQGGGSARERKGSRQGGQPGKNTSEGRRRGTATGATGASGQTSSGPGSEASGPRGTGQATSATRGETGSGGAATPGAYNPEDDDIVARQLREAAEQETDPELKKKLWKEYEAYKKNTRP